MSSKKGMLPHNSGQPLLFSFHLLPVDVSISVLSMLAYSTSCRRSKSQEMLKVMKVPAYTVKEANNEEWGK